MSLILPSLDQQTRAARESAGVDFMWHHIDTCLSCYLGDHHNRDGELLVGTYVDGSMTVETVLKGLWSDFSEIGYQMGESRLGYDDDKAAEALKRLVAENEEVKDKLFDSSLETPTNDDEFDGGEYCQAWFLLTWEVPPSET